LVFAAVLVALASGGCASARMRRLDRAPKKGAAAYADDRIELDERQRRAVVRFGKCTATHVGNGYFLTAGHCVNETPGFEGYRSSPCPYPLKWGEDEGGKCNVEVYRYDDEQDYALLRLQDPSLAEDLPLVPIDYQFHWDQVRKSPLNLYGYSKGTLKLDTTCSGKIGAQSLVLHDCTTEPGDSGSALIDPETHHIIGVHGGALDDGKNYGSPIETIPWAKSLCVASVTSKPVPIEPGKAPAAFRVSTSQTGGAFRRVAVALEGTMAKDALVIRIVTPQGTHEVDVADAEWKTSQDWAWKGLYELMGEDDGMAGPWSVEVSTRPDSKVKESGNVRGEIWVCP